MGRPDQSTCGTQFMNAHQRRIEKRATAVKLVKLGFEAGNVGWAISGLARNRQAGIAPGIVVGTGKPPTNAWVGKPHVRVGTFGRTPIILTSFKIKP